MKKIVSLWDKKKLIINWVKDKIKLITNWIKDKIKVFWPALMFLAFAVAIYLLIYVCKFKGNLWLILMCAFITLSYLFIIDEFNTLIKKENILSKSNRLSYMLFCYIISVLISVILCTGLVTITLKPIEKLKLLDFLTTLFLVTLNTMIMLCIACFVFCLNMLKKELNCKYALFILLSIKSFLLALTSSFAIITALSYLDIGKKYNIIYKSISIVVTMLYPAFDMYEYTYKKVDEYEKIIVSENYIG